MLVQHQALLLLFSMEVQFEGAVHCCGSLLTSQSEYTFVEMVAAKESELLPFCVSC